MNEVWKSGVKEDNFLHRQETATIRVTISCFYLLEPDLRSTSYFFLITFLSVWRRSSSRPAEASACCCTAAGSDTARLPARPGGKHSRRFASQPHSAARICPGGGSASDAHPQRLHQRLQVKSLPPAAPPVLLQLLPQVRVPVLDLTELQQRAGEARLQLRHHALQLRGFVTDSRDIRETQLLT